MNDNLTQRHQPDRSKINMHEDYEVRYWTHALGVSKEQLQKAVAKVGNSAAQGTRCGRTGSNLADCRGQ
jgi:uncharacterized protein DUF3606